MNPVMLCGDETAVTVTRNHLKKIIKIWLERWGFWQLCTTLNFCKKTIFDCATNMLFLAKLRSKTAKTAFWQGVTVTRNYLNFGKMPNLIVNADFREDSKSGLRSKIKPIKHEIKICHFWLFITDPAVWAFKGGRIVKMSKLWVV